MMLTMGMSMFGKMSVGIRTIRKLVSARSMRKVSRAASRRAADCLLIRRATLQIPVEALAQDHSLVFGWDFSDFRLVKIWVCGHRFVGKLRMQLFNEKSRN
jgi:hypothetical protein